MPATPALRALAKLARGTGRLAAIGLFGWVLWTAGRVACQAARWGGPAGVLDETVLWQKLGELLVVAPLALRLGLGVETPRGRQLAAILASGAAVQVLAFFDLHGRAVWAPWCWCVAALAGALPWILRRRGRGLLALSLFALGFATAGAAGFLVGSGHAWYPVPSRAPPPAATRLGRWRQDLRYLASELPRLHGNAFHTRPRVELEASIRALEARLERLSDAEVAVGLAAIVASVGDAHTDMAPWRELGFRRLPLAVEWFGDDLRVTLAAEGAQAALGRKLVSIGGADVPALLGRLATVISHDNEAWLRAKLPGALVYAELLHALGILPSPDEARLVVEGEDGAPLALNLVPVAPGEPLVLFTAARAAPLAASRPGESFWFEPLADGRTLFVRYARCDRFLEFRRFARRLFEELDRVGWERVVIDLRGNGGGNSLQFDWFFLPRLRARPELDRPDRLFVLIDDGTFSSAGDNAVRLERDTRATIVGRPTGGKPNSWGEVRWFELPNSGLRVNYSTRFERTLDDADPPTLDPHVEVRRSIDDFVHGRDPDLERALELGS